MKWLQKIIYYCDILVICCFVASVYLLCWGVFFRDVDMIIKASIFSLLNLGGMCYNNDVFEELVAKWQKKK